MLRRTKPKQNPAVAWRDIDGEVVIVSPEDSVLHELNSTGSFIWKHAIGEQTSAEIAQLLADRCDVVLETALVDTEEFIERLHVTKLLLLVPQEMTA
jgi:hypothetical protein